jgi:hypothetical protein
MSTNPKPLRREIQSSNDSFNTNVFIRTDVTSQNIPRNKSDQKPTFVALAPISFVTHILKEQDPQTERSRIQRFEDRTSKGLTFFVLVSGLKHFPATKFFTNVANLDTGGHEVESLNNLLY